MPFQEKSNQGYKTSKSSGEKRATTVMVP